MDLLLRIKTTPPETITAAVVGGLCLAAAATAYYALYGNILGISGLIGVALRPKKSDQYAIKVTIVCGIIFVGALFRALCSNGMINHDIIDQRQTTIQSSFHLLIAGILVGLGTKLSNGCTSGHGLCGLPRFSLRSWMSVGIFLLTGIISSTYEFHHLLPHDPAWLSGLAYKNLSAQTYLGLSLLVPLILVIVGYQVAKTHLLALFGIGSLFGFGLLKSGMSQPAKIAGFLKLDHRWDPTLLFVLMSGVAANALTFYLLRTKCSHPIFQQKSCKFSNPKKDVNPSLVWGSFLFGLGWSLGGLCPGPYLLLLGAPNTGLWGVGFVIGTLIGSVSDTPEAEKPQIANNKSDESSTDVFQSGGLFGRCSNKSKKD